MKIIPTTAVALTLLTAALPFAAFAEDSGSTNVSASAQVQTDNSGPANGSLGSLRDKARVLFPPTILHPQVEMDVDGSTSDPRIPIDSPNGMLPPHGGKNSPDQSGKGSGDGTQARMRGDTEIDARIDSLNKMIMRLGGAQRLSSDAKASLDATINAEIASLTTLKTQIDTEATTTLKADDQSITKSFRVYALVMPQAAINAASDRIMTIVADMQTLSSKIGTRISAAQAAGADVSAAVTAHADFDAKVADASVQAQAAVTETAGLKPDNGDATVMASNTATLKDAKTKLDAAQADLKAARTDVNTILNAIKGKGEVKATASTTAQ